MTPDLRAALAAEDAAKVAQKILALPDPNFLELVHELRYRRHLNAAIHALDGLAGSKSDGEPARKTIRRLRLDQGG